MRKVPVTDTFLDQLVTCEPFASAYQLHVDALDEFYCRAGDVLADTCSLRARPADAAAPRRHFFSTLFLATTEVLVGPSDYLPLYAMVNLGMRAWVTATDNILDDEYKEVFAFDLPDGGSKMKSMLTLMLADRVVSGFVADRYRDVALLGTVEAVSLRALMASALQESAEERGTTVTLSPEQVMSEIHARKTGDLFEAPLALPLAIENVDPQRAADARAALHHFGLACQVLDDITDLRRDIAGRRHNVVVSLVHARQPEIVAELRQELDPAGEAWDIETRFPEATADAIAMAHAEFNASFDCFAGLGLEAPGWLRDGVVATMFSLLTALRAGAEA